MIMPVHFSLSFADTPAKQTLVAQYMLLFITLALPLLPLVIDDAYSASVQCEWGLA